MSTLALSRDRAALLLRWLPSPVAIFGLAMGGVLLAITVAKGVQDPDYFWHVTTGELIATTGQVPSSDPFSFTWQGQPWTPHEWLSELLIYRLVEAVGSVGALFVFGIFPGLILGVLAAVLAARGVRTLPIAVASCLAALVLVPYVTLRPQAISWLLTAILIGGLLELRPEHRRRSLLLVPFFLLWANLHGLYVIGLGILAVYVVFTLAGRTPMAPAGRWVVAAAVGAVLASMATPAGPIGVLYPLRYIDAGDWGLTNIQEWQSPNFHEPAHLALLALILAVAANGGRATPGWLVALSYIGVAMSLLALRNAPLAAVMALPTLAMGLDARLPERRAPRSRGMPASRQLARRIIEIGVAAVVVAGAALVVVPRSPAQAIQTELQERFPIAAVDRLERIDPDARVLAQYGWGGYVIWRLHDRGGRVFVDGRNDMYDERILDDYSAIRAADPGWERLVERYGVEAILLPPDVTLVRGPAQSAGWCEAYRDERQVLLLRHCRDAPHRGG